MPPTQSIEHVVVGAGPAGLRAAQVLAEAGREVVVFERRPTVGPKTCAGGLTHKSIRELEALGLPPQAGVTLVAHGTFRGEGPFPLRARRAVVRTLSRAELGTWQAEWARRAGAEIRTGCAVSELDLAAKTLVVGDRRIRYRHLIGADGSTSAVRRALGVPSPRDYFAGEFNVRGLGLPQLLVAMDSAALANGYFWIFPHHDYTSIGAGVNKHLVPASVVRPYLERRARELGVDLGATPFEGATIEVHHTGFDFPDDVHLVGDAAGCASSLTAEGIYPALVTGEEVARGILEPGFPRPKTTAWMRKKAAHARVERVWSRRWSRELTFSLLHHIWRRAPTRRWLTRAALGE